MPPIRRRQFHIVRPAHRQQHLRQQSPTRIQFPRIRLSKRRPSHIQRKQPGILTLRRRLMHSQDRPSHRRPLLQLPGLARKLLSQLRNRRKQSHQVFSTNNQQPTTSN
jgi:hypothetical protein